MISPFEPLAQNIVERLQPPDAVHLWGTDGLGRDIFSRVMHGTRTTIPAGLTVIAFGGLVGSLIGAFAGYLGGIWDEIMMRVTELFMAFPTIILAMAIAAALGPSIENAIIALVIVWWPTYARMMRGLVLTVKNNEYVDSAYSIGAPSYYVLFRTIVPNCISPLVVLTTLDIGNAILTFAGLSFLGLGPEPTSPEWGADGGSGHRLFRPVVDVAVSGRGDCQPGDGAELHRRRPARYYRPTSALINPRTDAPARGDRA